MATAGGVGQRYLSESSDPATAAILGAPLFLLYHVGLFLLPGGGRNGVDFVTGPLHAVAQRSSLELGVLLMVLVAAYAAVLWVLRRRRRPSVQLLVPVLLEGLVYAVGLAVVATLLARRLPLQLLGGGSGAVPSALGTGAILVLAAGAGFYEELVFRVALLGGGAQLLRRVGMDRRSAAVIAVVTSSLLFAAAHHVGIGQEPFVAAHFFYRTVAGLAFGGIYLARGFAVAVYAHAAYDVLVLATA